MIDKRIKVGYNASRPDGVCRSERDGGLNMENAVTGKTLIGEIVNNHPEAIEILLSIGMHCLGCPASQMESLEDACAMHGIPADKVIEAINAKIAEA